jgi:hypothetical protein
LQFVAALNQAGLAETKEFQYTTAEKVFHKRFQAFASIQQPPPLSYNDFLQGCSFSRVSQSDLLVSTGECFKASKANVGKVLAALESLDVSVLSTTREDLNQMAKVCVGNSVYLQKLRQAISSQGVNWEPSALFDFDANCEFCTIKLG